MATKSSTKEISNEAHGGLSSYFSLKKSARVVQFGFSAPRTTRCRTTRASKTTALSTPNSLLYQKTAHKLFQRASRRQDQKLV